MKLGDKRKSAPEWHDLTETLGRVLVSDVLHIVSDFKSNGDIASLSTRWFLQSLVEIASTDLASPEARLIHIWKAGPEPGLTTGSYTQLLLSAFKKWQLRVEVSTSFSATTGPVYIRSAARVLTLLGESFRDRYASFPAGIVSVKSGIGSVKTLGELEWDEYGEVKGLDRDKLGLDLVSADALKAFEAERGLHRHGQLILSTEKCQPGTDQDAWSFVRHVLVEEAIHWRKYGYSSISLPDGAAWLLGSETSDRLGDAEVWKRAGFTSEQVAPLEHYSGIRRIHDKAYPSLVLPCLGPTARLVDAFTKTWSCHTGWTSQPIYSLSSQPLVVQLERKMGVCSSVFATSFKARAGHEIVARLEAGMRVPTDRITALWGETQREVDPLGAGNDHATLQDGGNGHGTSLLATLQAYQELAEPARSFDPGRVAEERLLFALTKDRGIVIDGDFQVNWIKSSRFLCRPGVSYRVIRKTFLVVRYNILRSVTALKDEAGHASTNILQKYYLTTDAVKKLYMENLRFFQGCLQAHILERTGGDAIEMIMSLEERAWFKRLSDLAGVSAALGVDVGDVEDSEPRATFRFNPSDDQLRTLYLTHLSLKRCRRSIGALRWAVQGIPLLAAMKAVGVVLILKGLKPRYVKQARKAHRDLVLGLVALPPTLEI